MKYIIKNITFAATLALMTVSCAESNLERKIDDAAISYNVDNATPITSKAAVETKELEPITLVSADEQYSITLQRSVRPTAVEEVASKAAPVTGTTLKDNYNDGSLRITAFKGEDLYIPQQALSFVSQQGGQSSSLWNTESTFYWPETGSVDFWSWAPYSATVESGKISGVTFNDGRMTFTYTSPKSGDGNDAELQKDVLLAFDSASVADSRNVNLLYKHALSAISFKVDKADKCIVKSVSLSNVYSSATCTFDGTDITWSGFGDATSFTETFNKVINEYLKDDYANPQVLNDGTDAKTLLLIPQSATDSRKVTMTLVVRLDGASEDLTLSADLSLTDAIWEAGWTYTYSVEFDKSEFEYKLDVVPSENIDLANISYAGDDGVFSVKSYIAKHLPSGVPDEISPVAWHIDYSVDGGLSWTDQKPEMLKSISKISGEGGNMGENLDFSIDMQHFTFIPEGINTRVQAMKSTTVGSNDNYVDVRTLANNGQSQATANCYLVGHPGYYKLPLVYGNTLRADGSQFFQRVPRDYDGSGQPSSEYFEDPVDHNNVTIDNAYIYSKYTCNDCVLVWQDEPKVVKNVHISPDKQSLMFEVDYEHIMPCNAVVAVRNEKGEVMWTWHIWVTDIVLSDISYEVAGSRSGGSFDYTLLQFPVGWCDGKTTYYGETNRTMMVRFTQEESGDTKEFTLNQLCSQYTYDDNCLFFQLGRISPEPPAVGFSTNESKRIFVDDENYRFRLANNTTFVTMGEAIQHPQLHYPYLIEKEGAKDNLQWREGGWRGEWGQSKDDVPVAHTPKTIYDPSPVGYMVTDPNIFRYYGDYSEGGQWYENKVLLRVKDGTYKIIWPTGQRDPKSGEVIFGGVEGRVWCQGAYYGFLGFNGFFNNENKEWGNGWNCPAQALYVLPMKEN